MQQPCQQKQLNIICFTQKCKIWCLLHFLDIYGKYGTTSTWNIYAKNTHGTCKAHMAQKAHRTRTAPMAHMAQNAHRTHMAQKTHKTPTERKAHRTS